MEQSAVARLCTLALVLEVEAHVLAAVTVGIAVLRMASICMVPALSVQWLRPSFSKMPWAITPGAGPTSTRITGSSEVGSSRSAN